MNFVGIEKHKNFIQTFKPEDIYFVEIEKKVPLFHTRYGTFYQIVTLDGIYQCLNAYGFEYLDTVNLVNLNQIQSVDKERFRVLFENGEHATLSRKNLKKIENLFKD